MSGDYVHPKHKFVEKEPLDTTEVNEAIQPIGETLNGQLGPHNIRAPLDPALAAAADTFSRTLHRFVEVDSAIGPSQSPQPDAVGSFSLGQDNSWQLLVGPVAEDDLRIEIATGRSDLILTAQVSHCYQGVFDGLHETQALLIPDVNVPDTPESDSFIIGLDTGSYTVLARYPSLGPDASTQAERREVFAQRIAAGGIGGDVVTDGWVETTGWSARAVGERVYFTKMTTGPAGIVGSFFDMFGISGSFYVVTPGSTETVSDDFGSLSSYYSAGGNAAVMYYPAQVQYAFRVDGTIIETTETGRFDNEQLSWQPLRVINPRSASGPLPIVGVTPSGRTGPMVGRTGDRPDAINVPMHSHRIKSTVAVDPGTHVVEVVARRVPCGPNRAFRTGVPNVGTRPDVESLQPENNDLVVYQRQLVVTESTLEPTTAAPFDSHVTVDAFNDEDTVSNESLVVRRLKPLADSVNAVKSHQVARGAITNDHLADYSPTLAVGYRGFVSDIVVDSVAHPFVWPSVDKTALTLLGGEYQLWGTSTASTLSWQTVVVTPLSRTLLGSIGDTIECVISVEGNVALKKLAPRNATQDEMHLSALVLGIGLEVDTGTGYKWRLWRPSVGWANSNNYFARQPAKGTKSSLTLEHLSSRSDLGGGDFDDIPLSATFVLNGAQALGVKVRSVGIFACATHMTATAEVADATIERASINVVATKS